MNQASVNRAVARATGESVNRIQRIGFNLVVVPPFRPIPRGPNSSNTACHCPTAVGAPRANLALGAVR